MKCRAGSGGGGARTEEMAQKQKAVYFKVIDAIFFHDLIFNSERRAVTAHLGKRFK